MDGLPQHVRPARRSWRRCGLCRPEYDGWRSAAGDVTAGLWPILLIRIRLSVRQDSTGRWDARCINASSLDNDRLCQCYVQMNRVMQRVSDRRPEQRMGDQRAQRVG